MSVFLLLNTKDYILKNVGNLTATGLYAFFVCFLQTMDVMAINNPMFSKISSFVFSRKKEAKTGLEQLSSAEHKRLYFEECG